ncbi:hypothetical protein C7974DRAFT_471207 [Boeremia exigua]|uniref:uncharacterized protein n=1 Tax=Boeremia exigua TaxID=749465 RepID=UPI001E8E1256|nr:uncharacterized protein C7974DRAFT_471207 [Boeremia exigua]KAH6632925.1 hypothetical protein C7974DRAFT_471207 [Boeremia exigua]
MRFTTATIATMAAAATATVIPRSDLGAWNVTMTTYGGADRAHGETVTGVYANAQLADNIPVTCRFDTMINGEVVNKKTCNPESFSYEFVGGNELTLSQTLTLDETEVTVKGVSDKFEMVSDGITGKSFAASNILVTATTGVA